MECYNIQNLTFAYPGREKPALDSISLTVESGQFVTFCGPSGCGKTTLLRQLKPALAPHGAKSGEIFFEGLPLSALGRREQSEKIGFVLQGVENQLVTDKVWHELAFGLESLGYKTPEIRLRVAEMASFFGIETWFYKNVTELSGGQKQLLNLASIMAMQPSVLILDEPTSQLDPIAAADFLATVGKINRELGVTVILTEHRLEEVFPLSDRVICMDTGKIISDGTPRRTGEALRGLGHGMFLAMPTPMRIYAGVQNQLECPVTVRDGRKWLDDMIYAGAVLDTGAVSGYIEENQSGGIPAIELNDVWFRYEKDTPDVVRGLSFTVTKGSFLCVVGGNGTGKTTALSLIGGINKPYRGSVRLFGEDISAIPDLFGGGGQECLLGILPQNPQTLFVKKTVREDLLEILSEHKLGAEERERRIKFVSRLCAIEPLLDLHPYDLSGGEQQRAALAKVLLLRPRILLLDEPTKGLDAEFKQVFAAILKSLLKHGMTIVMVSHDVEFCAEHGGICAMFFDGSIISKASPREFFSGNSFYTTSSNRMARAHLPTAVTAEDVIRALGGETGDGDSCPSENINWDDFGGFDSGDAPAIKAAARERTLRERLKRLPLWRKITAAAVAVLGAITIALILINLENFKSFLVGGSEAERFASSGNGVWFCAALLLAICIELTVIAVMLSPGGTSAGSPRVKRRLSKRTRFASAMIMLAIPLTIWFGIYYLDGRKYYFISMLIILETMLPFVMVFEGRKPQAREIVMIAVLCAIGIAGRTAFFMLPQFKPVTAMAIIAGVAFGGETGFMFGAATGFLSNMFFGQGPWTPWQMFTLGIIGFIAGVLFRNITYDKGRLALCVYGGIASLIIYGGIMNIASVFLYQAKPTVGAVLAYLLQGLPFDLVHAAATAMFLSILSRPLLEKLDRIKLKYGMLE